MTLAVLMEEVEGGVPIADVIRKHGISRAPIAAEGTSR